MYCRNCGTQLQENSKFCVECGAAVKSLPIAKKRSNSKGIMIAVMGAIILGMGALGVLLALNLKQDSEKNMAENGAAEIKESPIQIADTSAEKIEDVDIPKVEEINEMNKLGCTAISAGYSYIIGVKSDGSVVGTGSNNRSIGYIGWKDDDNGISDWSDIIAVSAGVSHIVGLKSDGTVVAVGNSSSGQCNVSNWNDIIAISAGSGYTVGLKSDGTVVAVGNNPYGQCDVQEWTDIIAISAGSHTVGLKKDGTVVAVGANDDYGYIVLSDLNSF